MNKKITSSVLAALMVAGSTSFTAFAAMSNGTVVIGTKAFDLAYANDPANMTEITNAVVAANGAVYIKDFQGNWINNATGLTVAASVIPAVVYKDAKGVSTSFDAADNDQMAGAAVVTAISANSFLVKFNVAPTDTSKVTFAVKGSSGTAITTTATWNASKTEATVTSAYNLTADTYSVNVKNDTTDLGTSNVEISQQKVTKIDITSTVLSIAPISYVAGTSTPTPTSGEGFATYLVKDQYGNDITNTPLGNNISWNCGIGTVDSLVTKNGVIGIKAQGGIPLTQYTTASINGYDTDNYVTVSASLPVSQSTGVVSDIKLNKLTSPNNDDFNAGNTTGQWYADYTALDASGNPTTNYTIIKAGILAVNGGAFLDVDVVKDPTDNAKAAISVKINPLYAGSLAADTQVPVTVLTSGGKNATLTVTLKKATSVNTFTVSSPAQMVASGETVNLPFTAVDQNGAAVTKYSDLVVAGVPKVNLTISGGGTIGLVRNADGTASVQATMPTTTSLNGSLTVYIQSNVIASGKSNQLTLSVQQPVKADTLSIDTTVGLQFMQAGSSQGIDSGYDVGGIAVNDQFGRAIDLANQETVGNNLTYYTVKATSLTPSVLTVAGDSVNPITFSNRNKVTLSAIATGSATVNYEVFATTTSSIGVAGTPVSTGITKSVQYTVVKNSDITDYTLDAVTNPIRMIADSSTAAAIGNYVTSTTNLTGASDASYAADPGVYGKTAGGALVKLATSTIKIVSIDSGDFLLANPTTGAASSTLTGVDAQATDFGVFAKKLSNPTSTSSSTNLTVTLMDSTGNLRNVTTAIKSTTDGSTAQSIGFSAGNSYGNRGISIAGNTVSVSLTNSVSGLALINGKVLTKYDTTGSTANQSAIYFYAKDQFGQKASPISLVTLTDSHFANGMTAIVDSNNALQVSAGAVSAGDYVVLSAVTSNGQIQTMKILFTN